MTEAQARTVLIAEDDAAVRSVLARGLQRGGYVVVEESGATPIDFDAHGKLDVFICDVGLPAENGYETARRCREKWRDCEIILLSGHAPEELQKRGVPAEAKIVQKPISPKNLTDLVAQVLTMRAWRSLRTDEG